MKHFSIVLIFGILSDIILLLPAYSQQPHPGSKHISSIFWTWQDKVIENQDTLKHHISDLKKTGFRGLYAMPRATRYQLYDNEMFEAVKLAGAECEKQNVEFIWGIDPRFLSGYTLNHTGYGAQMLMVNENFKIKVSTDTSVPQKEKLTNEVKLSNGRYSLKYNYPQRRDIHMLHEVGLWLNPIGVDKVIAYQKKDGKILSTTLKDITVSHRLFINRSNYYVEVFGKPDLPEGEWWVFAFPRFATNMYAFDSPEHEKIMFDLLDKYKEHNIHFDGFWWDEPGYYFQYGHYPVSERVYIDFYKKYGYDLKKYLEALVLDLSDNSHLKVRYDYFQLLMDYVFGGQERFWQKAEQNFGPVRMGVHHTWHDIPDDMYAGCGDYWRGLKGVDGGYTDDDGFEEYFTTNLTGKYRQISKMLLATSLAKFARNRVANYNRWGVNYKAEVPIYWNDLMAMFSNEWIQHIYGNTGVIDGLQYWGPGFPNHETWPMLPDFIKKTDVVRNITKFNLPIANVAVVYPITTFLCSREPENSIRVNQTNLLLGIMPSLGIQADGIADWLFSEGRIEKNKFRVRNETYDAVLLPFAEILTSECLKMILQLKEHGIPCYFMNNTPQYLINGEKIEVAFTKSFDITEDTKTLEVNIESLKLPTLISKLKGGYVSVVPGDKNTVYVMIMPVEPNATIEGELKYKGRKFKIDPTNKLAIYRINALNINRVHF